MRPHDRRNRPASASGVFCSTAEISRRRWLGTNIPSDQKSQANLGHFAASRHWYTRGKRIATIQIWVVIGFPLFAALILIRFTSPEAKVLVTFFGISAAVVEVAPLDPMQKGAAG